MNIENRVAMMLKTPPTNVKAAANTKTPPAPLPGFATSALFSGYVAPGYIVKQILEPSEIAVVFGDSGAMKSFAVIDLAMHVATGTQYARHRVNRTGVLYIAGEGGEGIKRRLRAWMIANGIAEHDEQPSIWTATRAADLMFDGREIQSTLDAAEAAIGGEIGVVVFDTLAASFGDGDENAASDMTKVLNTARLACGSKRAIVLVHHVGHGDKARERGSYALRAAADRRILVERPGDGQIVTLTCAKAKDGEPFKPIAFEWKQIELGWFDGDGEELTSVVLEPTDREPVKPAITGKVQKAIITLLTKHGGAMTRTELVTAITDAGGSRTGTHDTIRRMIEAGTLIDGFQKLHLPEEIV